MSPSIFNNNANANEMNVNSTGELTNNNVNNGYGVRPISYYIISKKWGLTYIVRCFMSPSNFNNWANANEMNVNSTGELNNNNVNNGYGVRPISYYKLV